MRPITTRHVVNIDGFSASTAQELENLLPLTDEYCISRVPEYLRQFNEHFYTPKVVSIGPIHHGKKELRAMEDYKKRCLVDFLRFGDASLKKYFELVRTNETKLRNCYADPIELDSEDFMQMVLLDAVFLLMTFLCSIFIFEDMSVGGKRILSKETMMIDIQYDLVLLENQLPFFIVEELYKLSNIHKNRNLSSCNLNASHPEKEGIYLNEETAMRTLAIEFFNKLSIIAIPNRNPPTEVEHLLALFRSSLKPANWNPQRKRITTHRIPSIKDLNQAGVEFKVTGDQNLFDIKFNNGVLEIPAISVHDRSELMFRNLLAFERCHKPDDLLCIDYLRMMQKFTSDPADTEVLIRNKIFEYGLPNAQAISTLFHNLSPGFVLDANNFGYADVVNGLNAYYAIRWNRWKATWIQKYFKAPWAIFSFIAAVFLIILTFVQTVCSILQVGDS